MNYHIINERKKMLNLTNAQLANITGITLSTLDKITSGANTNPKLSTLQAIAKAINCTLDDFDDVNPMSFSNDACTVAYEYDRLDSYGQSLVKMVIKHELERIDASTNDKSKPLTDEEAIVLASQRYGSIRRVSSDLDQVESG